MPRTVESEGITEREKGKPRHHGDHHKCQPLLYPMQGRQKLKQFEKPEPDFQPEPAETLVEDFHPMSNLELTEPQIIYKPQAISHTPYPPEPEINEFQNKKSSERVSKLRELSEKLKTHQPIEQNLYEIENVPAYKRRHVELSEVTPSSVSQIADFMITENADKSIELKSENKFLNKKVD